MARFMKKGHLGILLGEVAFLGGTEWNRVRGSPVGVVLHALSLSMIPPMADGGSWPTCALEVRVSHLALLVVSGSFSCL